LRSSALASLIDIVPTLLSLAGAEHHDTLRGRDLTPILAHHASADGDTLRRCGVDFGPVVDHRGPQQSVQDAVHFTYDDHQAATALKDVPGQPNRIRCIRDGRMKYAFYFDPAGRAQTEHEMYDLERDPDERINLVDRFSGEATDPALRTARQELGERLDDLMDDRGTHPHVASRAGVG
jgi:arylsulfatase A-like enzyme